MLELLLVDQCDVLKGLFQHFRSSRTAQLRSTRKAHCESHKGLHTEREVSLMESTQGQAKSLRAGSVVKGEPCVLGVTQTEMDEYSFVLLADMERMA